MWEAAASQFHRYLGVGWVWILYLLALVYLWRHEGRREVRSIFWLLPAVSLALFFLPLLQAVMGRFGEEEVTYRFLWLLPVTATLAYCGVCLVSSAPERGKAPAAFALALVFALSGRLIYTDEVFHRAENLEHIPGSVEEICDAIRVPGREVMAAFPGELVSYVRQYSADVCMPYGRDVLVETWGRSHPLYAMIQREEIPAEELASLGHEYRCHYLVLPESRALVGDLSLFGFEETEPIGGYRIFRSQTEDFSVP